MNNFQRYDGCIYNMLYVRFNENIERNGYFYANMQYPTFYTFNNTYFNVNPVILKNINSTIKEDALDFKNGLFKEYSQELREDYFKVISTYAVTFNKNYVLSTILTLMGIINNTIPTYNQINNYNFDLLTGDRIYLKDVFIDGVDYKKLVNDYVTYKIGQNPDLYYDDVFLDIPDDQAFYLTDDGIVIYFGIDEIAPSELGVPKFTMSFEKFNPYINPRFYCLPENINSRKRKVKYSRY